MASLVDFPDEVLLHIGDYLSSGNLVQLALASRRLRGPALEKAWENPTLGSRDVPATVQISDFAHILLDRPDLGKKMRHLSIHVDSMDDRCFLIDCPSFIEDAIAFIETLPCNTEDWIYNLGRGDIPEWCALILSLTPGLTWLSIECREGGAEQLQTSFFEPSDDETGSLPSCNIGYLANAIPGLKAIKKVSLSAEEFEGKYWAPLPNLEDLELLRVCDIDMNGSPSFRVKKLRIKTATYHFLDVYNQAYGDDKDDPITGFFRCFPLVNDLSIEMTNDQAEEGIDSVDGFLTESNAYHVRNENLLGRLRPIATQFRHLDFTFVNEDLEFLDWFDVTFDFRDFTELKTLVVQEEVLVARKSRKDIEDETAAMEMQWNEYAGVDIVLDEIAQDRDAEDELAEDETADDETAEDESAAVQMRWNEYAEDEPAGDEPAEDETAEDEPAEDEPAEDEPAEDEPAEDRTVEDQTAEDENAGVEGSQHDTIDLVTRLPPNIERLEIMGASKRLLPLLEGLIDDRSLVPLLRTLFIQTDKKDGISNQDLVWSALTKCGFEVIVHTRPGPITSERAMQHRQPGLVGYLSRFTCFCKTAMRKFATWLYRLFQNERA